MQATFDFETCMTFALGQAPAISSPLAWIDFQGGRLLALPQDMSTLASALISRDLGDA